ncbi:HutD/Ves family protein [Nesterenkonia aurantiaca]|uniref:Environmental stress-induced protein Ves n=1 Tax=Nesterenkonia aurantiaca TaxID=1436010 RepID=A0A4V3ED33_9MICC|nr:HutD family protein [Nesterenkonia aurantiaca]TDS87771.1 environmental stress-induced protein Ves [Nesterenkonia aurantiaca]
MSHYEIHGVASLPATPWRNDQGLTRQIAVGHAEDGDTLCWRLSQADLQGDADFSAFPGVERVFTLMSTGPITLSVEGETTWVTRGVSRRFPGEAEVSATLSEGRPEKALNLMVARGQARGEVQILSAAGSLTLPRHHLVAVLVLEGSLVLQDGRTVREMEAILPTTRARSGVQARDGLAHHLGSVHAAGAGSVTVAAVQVLPRTARAIGSGPPAR